MVKNKSRLKRDIGIVLRGLRQKSEQEDIKLTQNDIADASGISLRYYSKLENGLSMPTIDVLAKIADSYKMSLSEICKQIEEC